MDRRLLAEMDAAYRALEARLEIVKAAVRQAELECASIWHSSHYARDGRGEFRRPPPFPSSAWKGSAILSWASRR